MTIQNIHFTARLFYSYCHKDTKHRTNMEKSLSLLRRDRLLRDWSDQRILAGQPISQKIKKEMDQADIIVFLLSQDFLASDECMKEWNYAKLCLSKNRLLLRIPIILTDCAWQDLLDGDDLKALPTDGQPVSNFDNTSKPWHQVYVGLKEVINQLRNNFTPRIEFLRKMEETGFPSLKHIKLDDIFVFLSLKCYPPQTEKVQLLEETVTSEAQLLKKPYTLIHGDEMSGKTALGRHLFLHLYRKSAAVLFIDLNELSRTPKEQLLIEAYKIQFNGDYFLWKSNPHKTLILDNLSPSKNALDFVWFARKAFDKIIVTASSDSFYAFFKDEPRLADFHEMQIEPLNRVQQEHLIRNRLQLLEANESVTDGLVDQVESRVNSIIISNKVVPRYPFYVLSILQTYEAFMPENLSISSYGHCYHALIVANLIKSGILRSDSAINACFNFAEQLAFRIYRYHKVNDTAERFDFSRFVARYKEIYILPRSILNRLKHEQYGILTRDGRFRAPYMYYYFLGRFFSKGREEHASEIERLCDESYVRSNHLILLFIIHHTNDLNIIDDILLRTMCTLDDVLPAVLDREETKRFTQIVTGLPRRILSRESVESERRKDRERLDDELKDSPDDRKSALDRTSEKPNK